MNKMSFCFLLAFTDLAEEITQRPKDKALVLGPSPFGDIREDCT